MNKKMMAALLISVSLVFAGCNVTIPKWPDGGTGIPPVLTNAIPPVVTETETNTTDVTGIPVASLPVTATVGNVKHGKGKTSWTMTGTDSWPKKTVKKEVQGMTYLYVWRDEKWQGGKFDWFRPGQQSKGHENIEGNYMGIIPVKGDKVAFGLMDINKAQRSNFVEGVWP